CELASMRRLEQNLPDMLTALQVGMSLCRFAQRKGTVDHRLDFPFAEQFHAEFLVTPSATAHSDDVQFAEDEGQAAYLQLPTVFRDRKSTRLNSSHSQISYAVFCLKKKKMKYVCLTHRLCMSYLLLLPSFRPATTSDN